MSELVRDLKRELEWIPLKAMRKEPRNRYQSPMRTWDGDGVFASDAASESMLSP